MFIVNSYLHTIISCFTLQSKLELSLDVSLTLTVFFIILFTLSLIASIYILFRENKKSKTLHQDDISPDKKQDESAITEAVLKTEETNDQKKIDEPVEQKPDIEITEAVKETTEVTEKSPGTNPKEKILNLFKLISPDNIRRLIKEKHVKHIEKISVITGEDTIASSLQSPIEASGIYITPSTDGGAELHTDLKAPALEVIETDTLQFVNDQPEADETVLSNIEAESTQPDIEPCPEPPPVFSITNLTIRPQVIFPGNTIFISFKVTNNSDISDYYAFTLKIGGFEIYSDRIYLSMMGSKLLTFPVKAVQPGTWEIDINGVSTTMTIRG